MKSIQLYLSLASWLALFLSPSLAQHQLFWTSEWPGRIFQADPDGASFRTLAVENQQKNLILDPEGDKMYWIGFAEGEFHSVPGRIRRSNLDGLEIETLIEEGSVSSMALDTSNKKIYWADAANRKIRRAGLDGTGIEDLIELPDGLADNLSLDVPGGKMYWIFRSADEQVRKIQRAKLDGTEIEDLVSGLGILADNLLPDLPNDRLYWTDYDDDGQILGADLEGAILDTFFTIPGRRIGFLSLDADAGEMYWTVENDDEGNGRIQRAGLDGENVEILISDLWSIGGMAIDANGGKLYWSNYIYGDFGPESSNIKRAGLDGSDVEILADGLLMPGRIVVDAAHDKLYWTNPGKHAIQSAAFDGNDVETLVLEPGCCQGNIAIDPIGKKIYRIDNNSNFTSLTSFSRIVRSDFECSETAEIIAIEGSLIDELPFFSDIALDPTAGKIYWVRQVDGSYSIQRADLDGTAMEDIASGVSAAFVSTALDAVNGRLYYTLGEGSFPDLTGKIIRVDLNTMNEEEILTLPYHFQSIALDIPGDRIYWAYDDQSLGFIQRAGLDGAEVETLVSGAVFNIGDMALDLFDRKMYWTAGEGAYAVQRADLDGTDTETLVQGWEITGAPNKIALFLDPALSVADRNRPTPHIIESIFPNPAAGWITVLLSPIHGKKTECRITNALGAAIHREFQFGNGRIVFNCSGLPRGVYYLHLSVDGRRESVAFVLQ